jgi:nucleoside-diphosphate-sugar epimerase
MKILITGGNGYVAKSLYHALSNKYDVVSITRKDFDLTNRQLTDQWFQNKHFDVVIHTAIKGGSRLTEDSGEVFYQNLKMFYNLFYNKDKFDKFIHFGSGAELGTPSSPYGLSKKIINDLTKYEHGFFNLRIFAVFDENELDTRFIKASIKRYINKEKIIIHQNKYMDFFYIPDLITLVNEYIIGNAHTSLTKVTECSYREKFTLYDIAQIINQLSDHKVPIEILDSSEGTSYIGNTPPVKKFIGLKKGIEHVYNQLK